MLNGDSFSKMFEKPKLKPRPAKEEPTEPVKAKPKVKRKSNLGVAARRKKVAAEYTGSNGAFLARKYGVSRQTIYSDALAVGKATKPKNLIDDPEYCKQVLELLKTLSHRQVAFKLGCSVNVVWRINLVHGTGKSLIDNPAFIRQVTDMLSKRYSVAKMANILKYSGNTIRNCIKKYSLRDKVGK